MDEEILTWWLNKYCPQIINYINMVVQFEELTPDMLQKKRRNLLLEYLDSSDSGLLYHILEHTPNFLDRLYDAIYKPSLIIDSGEAYNENA